MPKPTFKPLPELPPSLQKRDDETRGDRMVRLAAQLMQLGVSDVQVRRLLSFDLDLVERQLDWLPYRSARKRSSLIVAAIEHDYEAPANWNPYED